VVVADDRVVELGVPASGVRAWALRLESRPGDARVARLDAEEAAGLATMRPVAATRLLARRALLHRVAAGAAGCPVERVHLASSGGARRIDVPGGGWFVSASSSAGWGLVALADVPLGVDVEPLPGPPDALQVSEHLLPGPEHAWIRDGGPDVALRFLRTWVRKEAVVKATGEGLRRDLRSFVVDARTPTSAVLDPGGDPLGITTADVHLAGHVAAVALAAPREPRRGGGSATG
jgi:4'-phosphopantetheinyl transferase